MPNPSNDTPHILLGFDFGTKSIGVAVGQTITQTARPLKAIKATSGVPHWETLTHLVNEWQPHALVIGIPYRMDGTEQPITARAKAFAKKLQVRYGLTVYQADERLTTKEAKAQLFEKKGYRALKKSNIDSTAAQLILEDWLRNNA